jgi:hypothetical protein
MMRRACLPLSLGLAAMLCGHAVCADAQTHRSDTPQDVVRAVAVYEWTGDLARPTAARLVPISIYINSALHDAGTYLSEPVPFALESGTVYDLEPAGKPDGTVALDFARHLEFETGAEFDAGWVGYGTYAPYAPPKLPTLSASALGDIDSSKGNDDGPPSIKRPPHDPAGPDAGRGSKSKGSSSGQPSAPAGPGDDPDRPTLKRRNNSVAADQDNNALKPGQSGVTAMGTSLNADPDRPIMERGKPKADAVAPPLRGVPPNLHQVAAVSDAVDREPHVFTRAWDSPKEQADTLAAMQKLAMPLLSAYAQKYRVAALPTAKPAAHSTAHRSSSTLHNTATTHHAATHKQAALTTPPTPTFTLADEQLRGFQLSYGGLPTFVYTASATASAPAAIKKTAASTATKTSAATSAATPASVPSAFYITVVAERLPSGELQIALSSVTDTAHLDQTPWMRFVDAVDPDWEHRGSLLFELRAQSSRQFALYRVISAQAQQLFLTEPIQ